MSVSVKNSSILSPFSYFSELIETLSSTEFLSGESSEINVFLCKLDDLFSFDYKLFELIFFFIDFGKVTS